MKWAMYPIIWDGPITIHSFGLMLAIGVLVGSWFIQKTAERLGDPRITEDTVNRLVWWIVMGVLFGGRFMYVIVEIFRGQRAGQHFLSKPWEIFFIWQGGLVMYGGFLGIFVAVLLFAKREKIPLLRLCDVAAPGCFLGQAIGRWGCFLVGDDYGKPTDSWVGVVFTHPDALLPEHLKGIPLHPAQIYMSIKAFSIFLLLWYISRHRKFDGQVAGWAFIAYAILRSVVEIFRGDLDRGMVGPLSTAQFTSIFGFFLGLAILLFAPRRGGGVPTTKSA